MSNETEELSPNEQAGTLRLLWKGPRTKTRGPARSLTLEGIGARGVELADTQGISSVSMQRLAADLGLTKMALYRYFANKAELMAYVVETAVGVPPALTSAGWRSQIEEWADLLRQAWVEHPWLPTVAVGNRVMGPNEVGWIEKALSALGETSLSSIEKLDAVVALCGHIRISLEAAVVGSQPWTLNEPLRSTTIELLSERHDEYQSLLAIIEHKHDPSNHVWSFGLESLLDHIESLTNRRQ